MTRRTTPKRYSYLAELIEWVDTREDATGTPDISGFWRIIGGKETISWKCFYDNHYKKLLKEGLLIDHTDPETHARALLIPEKARHFLMG